jgi:outer membrane receptor for ferrienterochelin and colicin
MMTNLHTTAKNFVVEVTDIFSKEPIIGANIFWANTTLGTYTDVQGKANMEFYDTLPHILVVSYTGYNDDSLLLTGIENVVVIQLKQGVTLDKVEIIAKQSTQFIKSSETGKVEVIDAGDIRKAACCNLAEGFQTSSAVEVNYSDAVTGAKEIQMLGLEGVYIQHLNDGLPAMYGVGKGYYMDRIPAAWVRNISVSKGIPSVKNGISGITGSINIDFATPEDHEKTYIDLFQSSWGRTELSARHAINMKSKKWGTVLYGQGGGQYANIDRNSDSFLDIPIFRQVHIMNTWHYEGENSDVQMGIRYLTEFRNGGQVRNIHNNFKSKSDVHKVEYYLKNGFFFNKMPGQSMAYTYNGGYNVQHNSIGNHKYSATELMNNFSIIGITPIKNTMHKINGGINFYSDIIDEQLDSIENNLHLIQVGTYAEYSFTYQELVTIVAGYRLDYHSQMQWQQSPRLQVKYIPSESTTIRANIGRGFRFPVILGENLIYLASSRQLYIHNTPEGDIGWNYGLSFLQKFNIKKSENNLNIDFYRTHFVTQTMTDLDSRDNQINIHQYNGISYANNLLAELNLEPIENFSIKIAYKWDNVKDKDNGVLLSKSMLSPHKGLVSMTYQMQNSGWSFTGILALQGKKRLPTSFMNSDQQYSSKYAIASIQVSKKWQKWQWYSGIENLNHFRQKNPILNANNPYLYGFDATQIWAPIIGAAAYMGVRFVLSED